MVCIRTVCQVADAKPQDLKLRSMLQTNRSHVRFERSKRLLVNGMERQLWHCALVGDGTVVKCVTERLSDMTLDIRFCVKRDGVAKVELKHSQFVEPKDMVGVGVRVQDAVNDADPFAKQLEAEVRRRVDEQVATGEPKNGSAASSLVLGLPT